MFFWSKFARCDDTEMNTSDKLLKQQGSNTEAIMSKADELELRRYFIKALIWVSGAAVSIIISVGGFLYKKMDDRLVALEEYRLTHEEKGKSTLVEYSSRLVKLETDVQVIRDWQKDMQETVKESRSNQREILEAIRSIKGEK